MTNKQIIAQIAIEVYGEDFVREMEEKGEDIPLHTAQGWAARGAYRIKKGEHGIEARLWKKQKERDIDSEGEIGKAEFYKARSFLFRKDQVEEVIEE